MKVILIAVSFTINDRGTRLAMQNKWAACYTTNASGTRHAQQIRWFMMAAIPRGVAQAGAQKPIARKGCMERARRHNQQAIKSKVQFNLKSKVLGTNVIHPIVGVQ